jgi:hypothetical protein
MNKYGFTYDEWTGLTPAAQSKARAGKPKTAKPVDPATQHAKDFYAQYGVKPASTKQVASARSDLQRVESYVRELKSGGTDRKTARPAAAAGRHRPDRRRQRQEGHEALPGAERPVAVHRARPRVQRVPVPEDAGPSPQGRVPRVGVRAADETADAAEAREGQAAHRQPAHGRREPAGRSLMPAVGQGTKPVKVKVRPAAKAPAKAKPKVSQAPVQSPDSRDNNQAARAPKPVTHPSPDAGDVSGRSAEQKLHDSGYAQDVQDAAAGRNPTLAKELGLHPKAKAKVKTGHGPGHVLATINPTALVHAVANVDAGGSMPVFSGVAHVLGVPSRTRRRWRSRSRRASRMSCPPR